MGSVPKAKARFAAAPAVYSAQAGGVWDRRQRCWVEPPAYSREAAERIAAAMNAAYADGLAPPKHAAQDPRTYPFVHAPNPDHRESWGVWDRRHERWVERPCYAEKWAERIAEALIMAHSAGLADAALEKARQRLRRSR